MTSSTPCCTQFGLHRLLTFDRDASSRTPTVEVAHEALLDHWARLRTWIDDARDDLLTRRRLAAATADWLGAGSDPSFLYGGGRLDIAEAWAERAGLSLSTDEHRFLDQQPRPRPARGDRPHTTSSHRRRAARRRAGCDHGPRGACVHPARRGRRPSAAGPGARSGGPGRAGHRRGSGTGGDARPDRHADDTRAAARSGVGAPGGDPSRPRGDHRRRRRRSGLCRRDPTVRSSPSTDPTPPVSPSSTPAAGR